VLLAIPVVPPEVEVDVEEDRVVELPEVDVALVAAELAAELEVEAELDVEAEVEPVVEEAALAVTALLVVPLWAPTTPALPELAQAERPTAMHSMIRQG
jgi:hypothetical protein